MDLRLAPKPEAAVFHVLVVGDKSSDEQQNIGWPNLAGMDFINFSALDARFLKETAPNFILSPVISQSFDVLDLAQRLNDVGYRGQYRAIANRMPNPDLIRREVSQIAPNLDFDILSVEELSARHS